LGSPAWCAENNNDSGDASLFHAHIENLDHAAFKDHKESNFLPGKTR
jgi:hypothetical protein